MSNLKPGCIVLIQGSRYLLTEDDICVDAAGVQKRYTLYSLATGRRLFGCFSSLDQLQDKLTRG